MKINWAEKLRRNVHQLAESLGNLFVETFHYLALFAIGAVTAWAAVMEFLGMLEVGTSRLMTFCCCSSIWNWARWSGFISRPTICRCAF